MTILTVILSVLLAVAFVGSALPKIQAKPVMVDAAAHTGFSMQTYKIIGALELAAAVGVLVGLAVPVLGAIAALGLLVTMIGAVVVHVRVGDGPKAFAPAAVLGVLSLVVVVLDFAR